ncbi:MAG: RdgB/HAM1 family non-canonical purine NTP pyrophosphatase [Candidatus Altiarchaeota archaeon]|nr:RdgB/HAM1 family non-canonical purine NTP pyrophosphatase [Candidatus Altiarchaeota archaeon]
MEVLFSTSNKNKVAESNEVGRKYGVSFTQIHLFYPEIRSDSVSEVAKAGAEYVFTQIRKPLIVEDSGLFIKSLNEFPGAYSRFAFERIGINGILKLMDGISDREASFVSAVAYITSAEKIHSFLASDTAPNSDVKIFEGSVEGKITTEAKGEKGFGFDPIFQPKGYVKTFAEDVKTKNAISHRKIAFEKLCQYLKTKPAERTR